MAVNETMLAQAFAEGFPQMMFVVVPLILIVLLLSVLIFALWIWMIIDCAKRNRFRSGDRVVWILLLVLLVPIGMVLYYFMVMREE
jgi:hypothetical protein